MDISSKSQEVITMTESRKKYLEFLKQQVQELCNDKGCYEVHWDYRDEISPNDFHQVYEQCQRIQSSNYKEYLLDLLYEMNSDYDSSLHNMIENKIILSNNINLIREFLDSDFWEDMALAGYNGIEVDLDAILRQSKIRINLMFATEQEKNQDMGSIIHAFGNDYRLPFANWSVSEKDYDNALTYLIHQQGYTVKEMLICLLKDDYDKHDALIASIFHEIANNSAEAMSELTALVSLSGNDIIRFFTVLLKGEGYFAFGPDAVIGLFNEWNGSGSMFEIELEKTFVVPISMIREIQVEGVNPLYTYTVDSVYDLIDSCWKNDLKYTGKPPELLQEDISQTISGINALIEHGEV